MRRPWGSLDAHTAVMRRFRRGIQYAVWPVCSHNARHRIRDHPAVLGEDALRVLAGRCFASRAHTTGLAARIASEFCQRSALFKNKGAGKAGCWPHPWPACNKNSRRRHHRYEPNNRPSLRSGFNGCSVFSPVRRAFWPPSPAWCGRHHRKLGISVGMPGPHGLAVRVSVVRPLANSPLQL
jgi:hypothetical protein